MLFFFNFFESLDVALFSKISEKWASFTGGLKSKAGSVSSRAKKAYDAFVAKVSEIGEKAGLGKGGEKLWTEIDEVTGDFQGRVATYYDVNVTYQSSRVRAGVAFEQNGILEFHLKIPDDLQGQGIGSEIFKRAISDYSPSKVKGWWKHSDIYVSGESVNLRVFKEKVASGMKPSDAAFETPIGKILRDNGFDGVPEIIKNTPEKVVIYFNSK